MLPETFFADLL